MNYSQTQKGYLLPGVLIFGFVGAILIGGLVNWGVGVIQSSRNSITSEKAFQIAEAGIEYYRWHLAHDPLDFQDGTGTSGPYVHDFEDAVGDKVGEFQLDITPPALGSTIATIKSTGYTIAEPTVRRAIEVQMGIPSLAKYSVAANADIRFGEGTEIFGLLHSNGGVRFDGLAHNLVTSALSTYDDPDHGGCDEWAVHTHVGADDPCPPTNWNSRPDVFEAGRQVGVPAIDFAGMTSDLAQMKVDAQTPDGFYQGPSSRYGWNVVLKTDDTFDLYDVRRLRNPPGGCWNALGQDGWGTWSIRTENFVGNYPFPTNGIIFIEDDAWVEGQIDGARLTIVAARFPDTPATNASMTVNEDIRYTNYDGSDVVALIAQKNVNAGLRSNNVLTVDAALVAQNGRVGRYYYGDWWPDCGSHANKDTITLFGMIATNQRYGFAYTDDTGYETRNISYDGNLLYGPPPSFPLTGDQYEVLSWKEVDPS